MARTQLTQAEFTAYEKFVADNGIVLEGEVGRKNGSILGGYITGRDQMITAETLAAALPIVRNQLVFKSAAQREFDAVAGQLSETEKSIIINWSGRQNRLVLDGDPGLENFSIIVGWLRARGYAISDQNLGLALTNVINSGQRKLHWLPTPRQESGEYYADGRINHSKHQSDRISLGGETVEAILENSRERFYRRAAESIVGRNHAETDQLRRIVVTNPDGSTNWKETSLARNRAYEQTSRPRR